MSAALFFCVGVVYDRLHTREISAYGGVAEVMPRYAVFFMFMMLASVTSWHQRFRRRDACSVGAWKASSWVALFTATGLVLGATYMLWLYRRVMFGRIVSAEVEAMERINRREIVILRRLRACSLVRRPSGLASRRDGDKTRFLDSAAAGGAIVIAGR